MSNLVCSQFAMTNVVFQSQQHCLPILLCVFLPLINVLLVLKFVSIWLKTFDVTFPSLNVYHVHMPVDFFQKHTFIVWNSSKTIALAQKFSVSSLDFPTLLLCCHVLQVNYLADCSLEILDDPSAVALLEVLIWCSIFFFFWVMFISS